MHIVRAGWGSRAEKGHTPTSEWHKYSVKWTINAGDSSWFFLRIDKDKSDSTVEFADMSLKWYPGAGAGDIDLEFETFDPFEKAKSEGWQGVPDKNLIYNPDFELGGTGYFYDFSWPKILAHYQKVITAKPTLILEGKGVDGGTCAELNGSGLRAFCFPVVEGETYTVSADLKAPSGNGKGTCSFMAFDMAWQAALYTSAGNIPADQWKRYSWTKTWTKKNQEGKGYVLFSGDKILIDRIQVVVGTEKEYQAPPIMVGLVFDQQQYFIRGRDAVKAQLNIVPGEKRSGTADVSAVVKDAWGKEVWKKSLAVSMDKTTVLPVELPNDKLGTFHVDLVAKEADKVIGIGISRYAVIEKGVIQKRKPGEFGFAGVCQESFNFPVWLCEDHAKIQKDLGIVLNRLFASVPSDFSLPIPKWFSDELLAKCKPFNEAGIDVLPCVDILSKSVEKSVANLNMPASDDLSTYGENLKAYVTSLKSGFKYWEIFNEPNLWRVSQGSDKGKRTMFPAKYFEFQKVAYKTIKGVNPDLQVVCNALNNVQFDWLDEWMKLGAVDYMDKFSFHPYGITDFYDQGEELKKVMKSFKFNGQLVNSEKYYGANLFYDRAAYEETRRGYYLPYNEELATAGRSVQHYISSVAVGVPVCFFNPTQTISRRGPGDELFVYDFFSAYSAAIRFMANAGSGSPIELGQVVGAYVFPDASGGPLVAIWSPLANIDARMKLKADCKVYDIMGNLYSADERKIGVRVARDPSYIRFAPGTSKDTIEQVLKSSDIVGLGSPFDITLAITGGNRIFAIVRSRRNTPLNGKIKLISVPKEWVTSDKEHEFASLLPGETRRIDFEFEQIEINPLEDYKVSALAELNEEEFTRVDSTLRPLFAFHVDNIKADGDLSDWKDIDSIKLGEANLSKEFNSKLKRTGDQDLSAEVALGWNADYFAMVVMVTDDKQQSGESPMTGWQGDSLQIYFDLKNDAMTTESNSGDDVEYLFSLISGKANAWLVKGADGNYKGKANKTDGFNDVDVDVSITRSGNKTIYEIVFPLSKCLPGVTLGNDLNFGFSLLINDNDGQGRKTGLTFAPKGTEPYGHPESYSDLILRKK